MEEAGQEQSRQMAKSQERTRSGRGEGEGKGEEGILGNLNSVESCCETRECSCGRFLLLNIFSHSPGVE